jgi:hypothetical protein
VNSKGWNVDRTNRNEDKPSRIESQQNPPTESEVIEAFRRRVADDAARKADASTVADICRTLGIPKWHLYKVVLSEAQAKVFETHTAAHGPRKEMFGDIIGAALAYAIHCARDDAFYPIWTSRSYDDLKALMTEFVQRLGKG